MIFLSATASANDLIVEPRTVRTNDTVNIIVSLEGDAARVENVTIPLRNLTIIGEPSVSSEFAWINGETIRRKVFRYTARPTASGQGAVGPLTIGGQSFGPVAVQILADRVSGSNDPEVILRELLATGRDPFFVVTEIDRTTSFVGEQIIVTWVLYNAASVQQWQVVAMPRLEEFWIEEIDVRSIEPEQARVGNHILQRIPIRRVALFPLRSGRLRLGGMTIEAAILRRIRGGPFAMFEGSMVDAHFSSAPIEIDVQPIPEGPPVDATGTLSLECSEPSQRNGGPVIVQVALAGRGNIRAAAPPRFEGTLDGRLQVTDGKAVRGEGGSMTRRWTYLLFPASAGSLSIPPLVVRTFDPEARERRELRCAATTFMADAARIPATAPAEVRREVAERRYVPWVVGGMLAALLLGLALPRLKRELRLRRSVREVIGDGSGIRQRVDERVDGARLMEERSDRGDAYRALRSLLDAVEQGRDIADDARREIARRVRDLLA
ncbi:MAG TPA: BatD family protein [Thermoanaerobaculia bacterium]|jgi:hypothetical protein